MEGAALIYNMLNMLDILFFWPVDKTVENNRDKVWDQGF